MSKLLLSVAASIIVIGACQKRDQTLGKIELQILPSSGGSVGYSIEVLDAQLYSKTHAIQFTGEGVELVQVTDSAYIDLSTDQISTLNKNLAALKPSTSTSEDFMLDTWMYSLRINGQEYATFNSVSLRKVDSGGALSVAQTIVLYLMEINPLDIKLRAFS